MALTYGFVKCKVVSEPTLHAGRRKNEIQYHLHVPLYVVEPDGSAMSWEAAINVGTTDAHDLLKYKLVYNYRHNLVPMLRAAGPGFTDLTATSDLPALDFLRSNILHATGPFRDTGVMDGTQYPEPVPSLLRLLRRARATGADVYVFGRTYTDCGPGIHDVHMNQGSLTLAYLHRDSDFDPSDDVDLDHNAIWQDGALFVDFGQPEIVAYFTLFTFQLVPTDDLGNPVANSHAIRWIDEGSLVDYPSFADLR